MIILNSLTSNEVKYISRKGIPNEVIIRDEQTKEVSLLTPSFSTEGYYSVFTLDKELENNRQYALTIKDANDKILYRGLMMATTQEVDSYTVHSEEYDIIDTPTSNSKYKII